MNTPGYFLFPGSISHTPAEAEEKKAAGAHQIMG